MHEVVTVVDELTHILRRVLVAASKTARQCIDDYQLEVFDLAHVRLYGFNTAFFTKVETLPREVQIGCFTG